MPLASSSSQSRSRIIRRCKIRGTQTPDNAHKPPIRTLEASVIRPRFQCFSMSNNAPAHNRIIGPSTFHVRNDASVPLIALLSNRPLSLASGRCFNSGKKTSTITCHRLPISMRTSRAHQRHPASRTTPVRARSEVNPSACVVVKGIRHNQNSIECLRMCCYPLLVFVFHAC